MLIKENEMLNENELKVLEGIAKGSLENGGDFCFTDSIKCDSISGKQISAYCASLSKKDLILTMDYAIYLLPKAQPLIGHVSNKLEYASFFR
jgi:hypothetical protein